MRAKLSKIPLYSVWSGWLRFTTCFAGTTVTEYAPEPLTLSPEKLLDNILEEHSKKQPFTILKDLPHNSPLLSADDNAFADNLAQKAVKKGFIEVQGQALAYVPINFDSVDEYLGRLSPARRKDLRRKMKTREKLTIEILRLGDSYFNDETALAEFYAMYMEVFNQSETHFDLLSPEFFKSLLQNRNINGIVVCYKCETTLAGYNICLIYDGMEGGMLVDKYIGLRYPLARELNLYFVSWMVNLEFALQNRLKLYVAGWTDPEVKAGLGASFTFTRHLAWVRNPLLRTVLFHLRHFFESDAQTLNAKP
jgi:predicted N-acyltransferase